jgi:N6-adenosine-specific RNA methylase IME4
VAKKRKGRHGSDTAATRKAHQEHRPPTIVADSTQAADLRPNQVEAAMSAVPSIAAPMMAVATITVGKRHRADVGDVQSLAKSIDEVGLLHPIVVNKSGKLIAGERRLRAFELLGRSEIPVRVVDLAEIVRGELAENAQRKDFLPSEIDAIRRALEPAVREEATSRKLSGRSASNGGDTRDKIGAFAGVSGRQVEKIAKVVEAAEAEPERFGKLVADMDRSGRVNGVYRRLQNIKAADVIRAEPRPLPSNGPYRAGLIDIPWAYEPEGEDASERGVLPYPTMTVAQACAMDVPSILADACAVGLWVTNFILVRGLHLPILKAWSLQPESLVTWPKVRAGRGQRIKGQTEHLVIATRGKPTVTLTDQTTLLKGPFHLVQKKHSAKPIEAYDFFESLFPAPRYFDLFSRYQHNKRWDCHGNEAPEFLP